MQLHQLKSKYRKKKRRIGRGGKKGTYSGRGIKGQKARAGRKMKPAIRELIKRYPKLRGYRRPKILKNLASVNLNVLAEKFESGTEITPELLVEKRIIRKKSGKIPLVKILGKGPLNKKFTVKATAFSASAKEAIEKTGGKAIILENKKVKA
jgi:large subunit ribosomal protein L15